MLAVATLLQLVLACATGGVVVAATLLDNAPTWLRARHDQDLPRLNAVAASPRAARAP